MPCFTSALRKPHVGWHHGVASRRACDDGVRGEDLVRELRLRFCKDHFPKGVIGTAECFPLLESSLRVHGLTCHERVVNGVDSKMGGRAKQELHVKRKEGGEKELPTKVRLVLR